jgi:hypothetical protein
LESFRLIQVALQNACRSDSTSIATPRRFVYDESRCLKGAASSSRKQEEIIMERKLAFAAAFFLAALPLAAQTSGATAPSQAPAAASSAVDPAKTAAIKQLLDVTGSGKMGEEVLSLMMQQIRQGMAGAIPESDRLQKFMDTFSKDFQGRITAQQINDAIVPIYAEHLSLEDIQSMIQFYQTPAGQHVIKALPQIIQQSQAAGSAMGQKAALDTLRQMSVEYPELNQILPPQGAAAPSNAPAPNQARP